MNSLSELIKASQKQNAATQNVFGLDAFKGLAEAIKTQNTLASNLSGLHSLQEIAKAISKQIKSIDATGIALGKSIQSQLPAYNKPLFSLTTSLSQIAKNNPLVSDRISSLASNQLLISSRLSEIGKAVNQSHLKTFNALDIALQGISKSFLKDIINAHTLEEINVADEANETIAAAADNFVSNTQTITLEDLGNLRTSIVTDLSKLLSKSKSQKAKQFILDLITIIGFILTLYATYRIVSDKSTDDVVIETKREIEKINKELSSKIENELSKLSKAKVANTNLNLRYSTKKNSLIIGKVKKGQRVTVIEIRHKYLLISYLDMTTNEPKSGFVLKKYFSVND